MGVTLIDGESAYPHFGLGLDYSTAPDYLTWNWVETPLNLGMKLLITQRETEKEISGTLSLDLGLLWSLSAMAMVGGTPMPL